MVQVTVQKRKCVVCDKSFDQTEYFIHLQEEVLAQLLVLNETMGMVKETLELTYEYVKEEEPITEIKVTSSTPSSINIEDEDVDGLDNVDNVDDVKKDTKSKLSIQDEEFQAIMQEIAKKENKGK